LHLLGIITRFDNVRAKDAFLSKAFRDLILAGDPVATAEAPVSSGLMPIYVCWNPDPKTIDLPVLRDLLDRDRGLWSGSIDQALAKLAAPENEDIRNNCLALEIVDGGRDYVYRHYGGSVAASAGRDFVGRRLSAMAAQSASAKLYGPGYQAVSVRPEPLYSENANTSGLLVQTWRRLVVPTTRDGKVDGYLVANIAARALPDWPLVLPRQGPGVAPPERYQRARERFSILSAVDLTRQIEGAVKGLLGVGQVGVAILSLDLSAFRYVSDQFAKMLGTTALAMTRRPVSELVSDSKILAATAKALASDGHHHETETEVETTDGRKMYARLSFGKMDYNMSPSVALWVTDLTEHKRMEEELREARNLAERENRARQHLMASLAHDIRTPVNAVLGFADALKTLPNIDVKRAREYGGLITVAGDMLSKLIGDLLDLSRLEAGKYRLVKCEIDPADPLNAAIEIARPLAAAKSVELSTKLPKGLSIVADPDALARVAVNLLSNAIKFTQPKGMVSLALRAAKTGGIEFSVTDNGRGISPEALQRIANPFEQTDADEDRKMGTGLGLSIVRGLVELHGGKFSIVSALGKGTTVKVMLP